MLATASARPVAVPRRAAAPPRRAALLVARAADAPPPDTAPPADGATPSATTSSADLDKEVTRFARGAAATFAPRASTPSGKNPAVKGTLLYDIFGAQAWLSLAVGGLLSFNLLFPSDDPSIARLIGMWSVWMFTVPSLRARECGPKEKDALNLLFLLLPLANVAIPFAIKSFAVVFAADVALLAGVLAWKGAPPFGEQEV